MIFIDWISESRHANFNRAFLSAVQLPITKFIVFSDDLVIDSVDSVLLNGATTRVRRALRILRLCFQYRKMPMIFLTYDPLFVSILAIFINRVVVFEHNTTPEIKGQLKHVIWQRVFLQKVTRLAQFPSQYERLIGFKQRCFYIGSPIPKYRNTIERVGGIGYYIAASYPLDVEELQLVSQFISGSELIVKRSALDDQVQIGGVDLQSVDYIQLNDDDRDLKGIIITVRSQIRGTGWFNDAISLNVPVVITNTVASRLFQQTFPGHPFINVIECQDQESFEAQWLAAATFDSKQYIFEHNKKLRERLYDALDIPVRAVDLD